ncbi:MAG: hypothetical protein RAK22_03035 [Nanoarchaeota archaeon]|nr:hypothetical protein [Nanoarchaeota archaeon]
MSEEKKNEKLEIIKEEAKEKYFDKPDPYYPEENAVYLGRFTWYDEGVKYNFDSWLAYAGKKYKLYCRDVKESHVYGFFDDTDSLLVKVNGQVVKVDFWEFVNLLITRKKVIVIKLDGSLNAVEKLFKYLLKLTGE